jgi:hypothetical protein
VATFFTPRLLFLHVPKTGGTWFTRAAQDAGVAIARPQATPGAPAASRDHADLTQMSVEAEGRLICVFVRHPLDWWRSYWGYRMRDGWTDDAIDSATASDDFDEFVRAVVARFPGYASATFGHYLAAPRRKADFVGRFENLVDDACAMLRIAGEPFDEARLRAHPPENVNDYELMPARYRRRTARRLAQAERAVIDAFYPSEPVPRGLIRSWRCADRPRAEQPLGLAFLEAPGVNEGRRVIRFRGLA